MSAISSGKRYPCNNCSAVRNHKVLSCTAAELYSYSYNAVPHGRQPSGTAQSTRHRANAIILLCPAYAEAAHLYSPANTLRERILAVR